MSEEFELELTPEELVITFSRCANYPKDRAGILALAQGLVKASRITGVPMRAIVDRCTEISQWCPTDSDLLSVAREIQPAVTRPSKCPHALCDGTGWRIAYFLWTWHGGETNYIEKRRITEDEYEVLKSKVDVNAKLPLLPQEVYSGAYRCRCNQQTGESAA